MYCDSTKTFVWSVRPKGIKNILDNAITLDDPDSPLPVDEPMPELSKTTKKKRMPKVSPIKHFAYKQKEKEKEKGPQKLRAPKNTFVSNTKGGEKRKQETLQKETEHEARLRKEEEKVNTKAKDV